MNRPDAKRIAEKITSEQLKNMLDRAQKETKDWTKTSLVNKGMTKGSAWNILGKDFDVNHKYHILAKINMVREFGEYLPEELKPEKKKKKSPSNIVHQNPIFWEDLFK